MSEIHARGGGGPQLYIGRDTPPPPRHTPAGGGGAGNPPGGPPAAAPGGGPRRRCAPAELSYLLDAPEPERLQRFYRLWTAKEAYVKYLGTGLTRPLSSFSVIPPESLGIPLHWDLLPDACLCLCGGEVCRTAILPAAELPEREVYPAR